MKNKNYIPLILIILFIIILIIVLRNINKKDKFDYSMHNYGSTAGEVKFSLYNQGPPCTVTIKGGNNSRVLLNKEVNKPDYVGHVVIPADVTSLYCSSSLGNFILIPLEEGKIQYIIYLDEKGFKFESFSL